MFKFVVMKRICISYLHLHPFHLSRVQTVPTLLFNLHNLATHSEVQEKVFSELKAVIPDPKMTITSEILGNLPYLKATVKETFRYVYNR